MNFKNFLVCFTLVTSIGFVYGSAHEFDHEYRPNRLKLAAGAALFCLAGNKAIENSATCETLVQATRAFGNGISMCGPLAGGIILGADTGTYLIDDSRAGTALGSISGGGIGLTSAINSGAAREFMQPTTVLNTFAQLAGCGSGVVLNLAVYEMLPQSDLYFI